MEHKRRRRPVQADIKETNDPTLQTIQEPMNQATEEVSQAPQVTLLEGKTNSTQNEFLNKTASSKKTSGIKVFFVLVAFTLLI